MKRRNDVQAIPDEDSAVWAAILTSVLSLIITSVVLLQKLYIKAQKGDASNFNVGPMVQQIANIRESKRCCHCQQSTSGTNNQFNESLMNTAQAVITSALAFLQKFNTSGNSAPCSCEDHQQFDDYDKTFHTALQHMDELEPDPGYNSQPPFSECTKGCCQESQTAMSNIHKTNDGKFQYYDYDLMSDVGLESLHEIQAAGAPVEAPVQTEKPAVHDVQGQCLPNTCEKLVETEQKKFKQSDVNTDTACTKCQNVEAKPSCACITTQISSPVLCDLGTQKSRPEVRVTEEIATDVQDTNMLEARNITFQEEDAFFQTPYMNENYYPCAEEEEDEEDEQPQWQEEVSEIHCVRPLPPRSNCPERCRPCPLLQEAVKQRRYAPQYQQRSPYTKKTPPMRMPVATANYQKQFYAYQNKAASYQRPPQPQRPIRQVPCPYLKPSSSPTHLKKPCELISNQSEEALDDCSCHDFTQ